MTPKQTPDVSPEDKMRESVEVERIAGIIERFWQLHSIEPSTGFTPEELAKEICK